MRGPLFAGGVLVGALLLLTAVAIGAAPGKKFAQETANGEYAVAVAAGNTDDPAAIYLQVKSRPTQKVSGAWTVVCSKGNGAGSQSGKFKGTTTMVRKLKMSYGNPSACTASASAQLSSGGFLKLQLYATH